MFRKILISSALFTAILLAACSKKSHPSTSNTTEVKTTATTTEKPKEKEAIPKVISVNDKVALKSVDGRLYYDLQGHRYWRNNKDGKYYLFNKSMYNNPAFK